MDSRPPITAIADITYWPIYTEITQKRCWRTPAVSLNFNLKFIPGIEHGSQHRIEFLFKAIAANEANFSSKELTININSIKIQLLQ